MIDTRDLNTRLVELEDMITQMRDLHDEILGSSDDEDIESIQYDIDSINDDFDEDEYDILYAMREMIPEWEHGNVLVHDTEWEEYVKELLEDTGEMPRDIPWYIVIDWESTADNIQQDYSCVEYDGTDYWFRNC